MKTIFLGLLLIVGVFSTASTNNVKTSTCESNQFEISATDYTNNSSINVCILDEAMKNVGTFYTDQNADSGIAAVDTANTVEVTVTTNESSGCGDAGNVACLDSNHFNVDVTIPSADSGSQTTLPSGTTPALATPFTITMNQAYIETCKNTSGDTVTPALYECKFEINYIYNGINVLILKKTFSVNAKVTPETITATIDNVTLAAGEIAASNLTGEVKSSIAGTIVQTNASFDADAPGPVTVGNTFYAQLKVDSTNTVAFKASDHTIELQDANGNLVKLLTNDVTPVAATRTDPVLNFAIPMNYVGTFKLKLVGKLDVTRRRVLSEGEQEVDTTFATIPVQVLPKEETISYSMIIVAAIAALAMSFSVALYSQNKKLQKKVYEEIHQAECRA